MRHDYLVHMWCYNYIMHEILELVRYRLKVFGYKPYDLAPPLVCNTTTITDVHHILQISMGWSDDYLHVLRILGRQYSIARTGGFPFRNDPDTISLNDFRFRSNKTFLSGYYLTGNRVEARLVPEHRGHYSICIDGRLSCPFPKKDYCGRRAFMFSAAMLTWPYHDAVNRYN